MTRQNWIIAIVLGIVLTVVFTWPFAIKLATYYEDLGDYSLNGSMFSYNEYSFRTGKIFNREEYFNGYQFYPQPFTIAYSDPRIIPSLIYSPIFWVTNNLPLSVNIVTFLSFALSFIFSYYAINYFVKNPFASIIGATVYAFNPLSFSRMPVHIELLGKYMLPLVFLFGYKFFNQPTRKSALTFFSVFTLNAFTAIYFQIFAFLLVPFFAIPFLVTNFIKKNSIYFIKLLKNSLLFLLFLPIFIYFDAPYLEFSQKENIIRTLDVGAFFSARLIDFVSASPNSLLYGQFVENIEKYRAPKDLSGTFNYMEHSLSLNLIPFFLFLVFVVYFYKRFKEKELKLEEKLIFYPFIVLLLTSFVLTLGPYFQGWNEPLGSLKTPYYYLYQATPLLKAIRVPARFEFVLYVPFALFVAWGTNICLQKIKNKYIYLLAFASILTGILLENFTKIPYDSNSKILLKISEMKASGFSLNFLENKNTIHFPIYAPDLVWESAYLNWSTQTRENIANGNTGLITSDQLNFLSKIREKPNEDALVKLKAVGIDYVIIHKDLFDDFGKYKKYESVYSVGKIYDNFNTEIVDLNKYNFSIRFCDFNKDIEINLGKALINQTGKETNIAIVKNKSDCHLPNIYKNKYKEINFMSNDLMGNLVSKKAQIKLPILIEPKEQLILSEINGELKIE
ncbi:MAG: hypothetical protein A3D24_02550 [Candidatus Blackburnbacteria bacterium RIFCSPHIGHO2_02_FULL_39_13]|uniref:DUF6311 domain-containing protein n=1 Tax=Candidatus Blackburnbacteria bacterium RIFCSPLOWO2_01_FULL_40_20 TaxID=1797519 RepID=A0A1G1VEN3_9BACT|nr:MAG: hypothetical protein UT38_C0008G0020 [Microgenomates group bacterium GW2011_GWA2_39_19]OGY07268.1 MAG: hypothetical protein A2694_00175 [Candidatus Blackburnbacteria bacterium RIFCSPHIGHO2_01_FULL_40_17]OGY09260.1 MAG: hypothetical protein A3D24_02550 [Candidatus Blackburnbacteria bacterium RIFCSPHIGHO2_02_FULL_39_13]OGY13885.1 MAG: hypothetical protein A3A77_01140 [Candidatus Blackburnbacteria bacterium RIFCSPLOWO2_01_FULL_40_20]HBL51713.1 hypothetical protein [Candidatus Blackburnbact